jgi:membrane protein DedA with SNARE-associated domain/membrane-associated phospholipid phosphatase
LSKFFIDIFLVILSIVWYYFNINTEYFDSMNLFNLLLPAIEHLGFLGNWIILAVSFVESLAFIGLLFPGTVFMILVGFLASKGLLDIKDLVWFAAVGSFLGDIFSYYLGQKGKFIFKKDSRLFKVSYLEAGERFFAKHGDKSVILGRFIGPLRPIIPFVSGLCRMNIRKFIIFDIIGSIAWSFFYLYLGYFFGAAWQVIELWSTRIGLATTAVIIFLVLIYVLRWLVIKKGKSFIALASSIWFSIKEAVIANSEMQRVMAGHPRFFKFISARFKKNFFYGRPLSFLTIAFLYTVSLLAGNIESVVTYDPIVQADIRIANLMFAFRSSGVVHFFLWITILGKFQLIAIMTLSLAAIFWIWRKKIFSLALLISVGGSSLFVFLGKDLIHRLRPAGNIPVYDERFFSFPSNHAAMAVALYGFIMIILWKKAEQWKIKINILFASLILIFLVGFSRIYLGVHFLSDVLGGYLVGLIWLIISVSIIEWLEHSKRSFPNKVNSWLDKVKNKLPEIQSSIKSMRIGTSVLLLIPVCTFFLYGFYGQPKLNIPADESGSQITVSDPLEIFSVYKLNKYNEKLFGETQAPISLIIEAKSDDELAKVFSASSWYLSDPINFSSVIKIARAAIFNEGYLMAPMTPSFWNSEVNIFGFQKPTETNSVRQRHHARFWKTGFVTKNGKNIYVGTASLDIGLKWLVTHRIDPAIDIERDYIIKDLESTGHIFSVKKEKFVRPILGSNSSGDQFFTDGDVYILEIK